MATANEVHDTREGVLFEELDVLESIYIKELTVERDDGGWPNTISVLLHPATGMDDSKKFVCMTVVFQVPQHYPDDLPEIKIRNPRGMCEEELQSLLEDMKQMAKERQGGPMLFELIEMAKDCLTEGNIPHCECAICLEHFIEGDVFVKTDCYHYFHRHCLGRYAASFVKKLQEEEESSIPHASKKHDEKSLSCPMCRLSLTCNLTELLLEPIPPDPEVSFLPTKELINQQAEMAALYAAQKAKGGIIDLSEEKKKFLVDENTVVSLERIQKQDAHDKDSPSKKKRNHARVGYGNASRRDERGRTDRESVRRKNQRQDVDGRYQYCRTAGRQYEAGSCLQEASEEKETEKSTGTDKSSHRGAGQHRNDGFYGGRSYRGASNARQHYFHAKERTSRSGESFQELNNRDCLQEKQPEDSSVQQPKGKREHGYGGHQRQRRYHDISEGSATARSFDNLEGDDTGSHQGDSEDRGQSKKGDNHSDTSFQEAKESISENRTDSWHKESTNRSQGARYHPSHREYEQANRYRHYNDHQDFRRGHGGRMNRRESECGNFEDNEQGTVKSKNPRNLCRNERPSSLRGQEHGDKYPGHSGRVNRGKIKDGKSEDNAEKDVGRYKNLSESGTSGRTNSARSQEEDDCYPVHKEQADAGALQSYRPNKVFHQDNSFRTNRGGCKGRMPMTRDLAADRDRGPDSLRNSENAEDEETRPAPSMHAESGSDHSACAWASLSAGCEHTQPSDASVHENAAGSYPSVSATMHPHPQRGSRFANKPRGFGQGKDRSIPFKNKQTLKAADEAGTNSIKSTGDSSRKERLPGPPGFKVLGPPPGFSKNDNIILP